MGAGGVGQAIGYAVARCQPEEIIVADNDRARAAALVHGLMASGVRARIAAGDVAAEARAADGLNNATPMGMSQYAGSAFPAAAIGGQRWAFDAVYTPIETVFTARARKAGMDVLSGFELFFCQGLDAFEKFTGIKVPEDDARRAYSEQYLEDGHVGL